MQARTRSWSDGVLVISNRDDVHARAVLIRLDAVSGIDGSGVLFDTATFPMATDIAVKSDGPNALSLYPALPESFGGATRSMLRQTGSASRPRYDVDRLRSVYWRRPRPSIVDDHLAHPDLQRYAVKSSRETIEGLVERLALNRPVVDPPSAVSRASLKLLQIELARRVGLDVPRTLVTNDPGEAATFIEAVKELGSSVVAKSPVDLKSFAAHSELVDGRDSDPLQSVRLSPTTLQQRITGGPDLRITVVGQRIFGAARTPHPGSDDVDWRPDRAPQLEPFDPPVRFRQGILAMQRELGLSFGAYDFKCDESGLPYFLEVKPSGQWLFVEVATRQPIAEALARYLWDGPGAEWGTTLPALSMQDLDAGHDAITPEYAELRRQVGGAPSA